MGEDPAIQGIHKAYDIQAAIIGTTRPQQVEENAKAGEMTPTDDVLERIDTILGERVRYHQ